MIIIILTHYPHYYHYRILNFNGIQKSSITFSEAEGNPTHLDINGRFLVVLTDRNVVKIVDIHTPTKPKQIGSAGKFEEPVNRDSGGDGGDDKIHIDTPHVSNSLSFFSNHGSGGGNGGNQIRASLSVRKVKVNCDGTR